jgi:hypothetical protein
MQNESRCRGTRAGLFGAMTALLLLALSCAAVLQPGYTPKNTEETYVVQTVAAMTEALNAGDVPRFMAKVSSGYYRGTAQLETRIKAALANRTAFRIETTIAGISVDDTKVTAKLSWKESWKTSPQGATQVREGTNSLVFMRGMGIKLIDQREETLFGF